MKSTAVSVAPLPDGSLTAAGAAIDTVAASASSIVNVASAVPTLTSAGNVPLAAIPSTRVSDASTTLSSSTVTDIVCAVVLPAGNVSVPGVSAV